MGEFAGKRHQWADRRLVRLVRAKSTLPASLLLWGERGHLGQIFEYSDGQIKDQGDSSAFTEDEDAAASCQGGWAICRESKDPDSALMAIKIAGYESHRARMEYPAVQESSTKRC